MLDADVKILAIEDDPAYRKAVRGWLAKGELLTMKLVEAASLSEGLELISEGEIEWYFPTSVFQMHSALKH